MSHTKHTAALSQCRKQGPPSPGEPTSAQSAWKTRLCPHNEPHTLVSQKKRNRYWVHHECLECFKENRCSPQKLYLTAVGSKGEAVKSSQLEEKRCLLVDDTNLGAINNEIEEQCDVERGTLDTLPLNYGWCQTANSSDCYSKKWIHLN